jgi:hypothetical protein
MLAAQLNLVRRILSMTFENDESKLGLHNVIASILSLPAVE